MGAFTLTRPNQLPMTITDFYIICQFACAYALLTYYLRERGHDTIPIKDQITGAISAFFLGMIWPFVVAVWMRDHTKK